MDWVASTAWLRLRLTRPGRQPSLLEFTEGTLSHTRLNGFLVRPNLPIFLQLSYFSGLIYCHPRLSVFQDILETVAWQQCIDSQLTWSLVCAVRVAHPLHSCYITHLRFMKGPYTLLRAELVQTWTMCSQALTALTNFSGMGVCPSISGRWPRVDDRLFRFR